MKTLVLACNTIRGELEKAVTETGCQHPFVWVESGLHLKPKSLHTRLQEELDRVSGVDRVILAFGFCGHSVADLQARDFDLVIPRVDDCITLLLGSKKTRDDSAREGGVYFLTEGWLRGEFNLWHEYQEVKKRYGEAKTDRIYARMLANYKHLGLIDTGAYEVDSLLPEVQTIASALKLSAKVFKGSDTYLKQLLTGPWDEKDFVTIAPNTRVELSDLGLCQTPQTEACPVSP